MGLSGMPRSIVLSRGAGETERFAAAELKDYLRRMTGRSLPVTTSPPSASRAAITLRTRRREARPRLPLKREDDAFDVHVRRDGSGALVGGTPRALLHAVYALLEELGCRWLAPACQFYRGIGHEIVPKLEAWRLAPGRRPHAPTFPYRRRNIEEARSHTVANTVQMIDWMAKNRLNALVFTINYQHTGRFTWDKVRDRLTPELRKRGMVIEVGGHGYENFIHPDDFFDDHPEWFALINGERSSDPHHAFNTSNRRAMALFVSRVIAYVQAHPEIDVLDLWPNDAVTWSTDPDSLRQGSPARRQALVTKAVRDALRRRGLGVQLETISYSNHAEYPENFEFPADVIVDLWPFWHEYRSPIFDPSERNARKSLAPFHDWAPRHKGILGAGAYYMKYAWLSKPIVFPGLMWAEMSYFRDRGIQAVTTFGEPGNWLTYELTHRLFARLAYDASADINVLVADYCRDRFAEAAPVMEDYIWTLAKASKRSFRLLEDDPEPHELRQGRVWIARCRKLLGRAKRILSGDAARRRLLDRLSVTLKYMDLTLDLLDATGTGAPARKRRDALIAKVMRLARKHKRDGLFIDIDGFWLSPKRLSLFYGPDKRLIAPGERISKSRKRRRAR